jgi:hypothetical protein
MTAFLCAYAAVAYWLFWHALDTRPEETPALVTTRAALYLTAGPALLLGLWVGVAIAVSSYWWTYWRAGA